MGGSFERGPRSSPGEECEGGVGSIDGGMSFALSSGGGSIST